MNQKPQKADPVGRVVDFITRYCTHTKGEWAGQPFTLLPWQLDVIGKTFGTLKDDGTRRFRTVFMELPKKQGKTEYAAAIALHMLANDLEKGAEVYSAAADREQAGLVFEIAAQMVRNNRTLSQRLTIVDSRKRIIDYKSGSFYQVLSSEAPSKHGLNPSCVLFDELHAQPDDELWNVLTAGTHFARREQLVLVMTTAGLLDTSSIWWRIRNRAIKIRDGVLDDKTFLPVLFIADPDDDPEDENVWIRTNPSLGRIFTLDKIREDFELAKQSAADYQNFLRFRLNIPVSSLQKWIDVGIWRALGKPIDERTLEGRPCTGGLDLSSTTDLTAFCLVFPPLKDGEPYTAIFRFFVPEDNMQNRERRDGVPYSAWMRQGAIKATPGNVVDYEHIKAAILEDARRFTIGEIAFDPWNATQLGVQLRDEGVNLVEFRQGWKSMSPATRELEARIKKAQLVHDANPVMEWMISNVTLKLDPQGGQRFDKEKSTDRIDGVVALAMALDRAIRTPTAVPSITFI